jgi:hypothetical protein
MTTIINTEENITSIEQRKQIQDFIQMELLKRGFQAKITKFEEVKGKNGSRLEFETESFQTTPVIFKTITVNNFSSSISEEQKHENNPELLFRKIWISVHISYEHFDGGTNGCKLFDVFAKISSSYSTNVFDLQTR